MTTHQSPFRPLHAGVAKFSHTDGAERAFADARDWDPAADWIDHTALVEVHRGGRIVVRGSVAGHYVDVSGEGDVIGTGTGRGAVVGAVLGLLLGPSVFAVGLVGGATVGGAVEARHHVEPAGPVFAAIRAHVPEGSSAVVVVSTTECVAAMAQALESAAEDFEDHSLSPAAEAELRSALAGTPRSAA